MPLRRPAGPHSDRTFTADANGAPSLRSEARAPPRLWHHALVAPDCACTWLRLMESLFSAET